MTTLPKGWLTGEEADELRRLAAHNYVLELGAWKGRSTVALAETARFVVSVDSHRGIASIPDSGDSLDAYLASVRELPNVAVVVADFEKIVPLFSSGEFDLVYIDGNHDAESVARDADLARLLRPSIVAFHDWDFETVREGVGQVFEEPPVRVVGSLAVFRC